MWSLTLLQICFLIFKTSYRNKQCSRASDDGGPGGPWPPHFFAKYATKNLLIIVLNLFNILCSFTLELISLHPFDSTPVLFKSNFMFETNQLHHCPQSWTIFSYIKIYTFQITMNIRMFRLWKLHQKTDFNADCKDFVFCGQWV